MGKRLSQGEKAFRASPEGKAAMKAHLKAYYQEWVKGYVRAKKHPDPRTEANGRKRVLTPAQRAHKLKWNKDWHLKKYGISLPEYERRKEEQGGVCAICANPPGKHSLAVDHCHITGKVRDLLCANCNLMLGNAKDSVLVLYAAIAYLQGHG